MKQTFRIFNDFSKGLNTDFNNVNQDPNALLKVNNFIINNNGSVSKRKGLNQVSNIPTGILPPEKNKSRVVNTYTWTNVLNTERDIVVVQYGEKVYFYYNGNDLAANKIPTVIDLKDYLTSNKLLLEDIRLTFTEIKGRLVFSHSQLTPFYIQYSNNELKPFKINIKIRDYFGKDDNLKLEDRPTTLTLDHIYNLYNQGWDAWAVYSCYYINGYFPSNKDVLNNLYDSNLQNRQSMENAFNKAIHNGELPLYPLTNDELADMNKLFDDTKLFFQTVGSSVVDDNYYGTNNTYGAELVDFKKMNESRTLFEAGKGRIIKDLFTAADVSNIVNRPVIEEEDKPIDKTKWNDFHFIEEIHDIFFDGKNIKMVLTLDKEHGLVGGYKEYTYCEVNGSFGYYENIERQKTLQGSDTRIYSYDFSSKYLELIGSNSNAKSYSLSEGLWIDPSPTARPGLKFLNWYSSNKDANMSFSYGKENTVDFLLSNLSTDPHNYKSAYIKTESLGSGLAFKRNSNITTNTFDNIDNHTITKLPIDILTSGGEMLVSYIDGYWNSVSEINSSSYYGNFKLRGYYINSSGLVNYSVTDSYNKKRGDLTQFDKQKIKPLNTLTKPTKKIKLEKAECSIEALSRNKCVLIIKLNDLIDKPDEWLFNTDETGRLIGYDYITNNIKIKLNSSLYIKMKSIYENIKRDEYASKKLDEEYKDNPNFVGVKNIAYSRNFLVNKKLSTGLILEFDKVHNKPKYSKYYERSPRNPRDPSEITLLYGDYTETNNNELINKNVIIPREYRVYNTSVSDIPTNSTWGKYTSDYFFSLCAKTGVIGKNVNELPEIFKPILINRFMLSDSNIWPISNFNISREYIESGPSNLMLDTLYISNNIETNSYDFTYPQRFYWGEFEIRQYPRKDPDVIKVFKENQLEVFYDKDTGEQSTTLGKNFSTTGKPESLFYGKISLGRDGDKDISSYCSFDFTKMYIEKPILNTTIEKRKTFKTGINYGHYLGDKYFNIVFDENNLEVYDNFEGTVKKVDTDKFYPFVFDLVGRQLNFYEIFNMKFCLDGSISPDEILQKQRAYRNAWTWDMDGLPDEQLLKFKPVTNKMIEISTPVEINELEFADVSEEFRPNCSTAYAGRVFYGGINCNKYSSSVFYSRIITEDINEEISRCYTVNDPTAKYHNRTLATDGGYINIDNAGTILGLRVIGSVLCVITSNGVWGITGANGYFQADSQSVKKISNVGCIAAHSIEVVDNTLIYCSEYAINALVLNNLNADLIPNDITKHRINNLYNNIPDSSKRYVKTVYDSIKGIIYFLYSDKEYNKVDPSFNNILVYNMIKNSFFTFSIDDTNYKVKDAMINEYVYNDMRLKLICSYNDNIFFYDFIDDNYLDFVVEGYDAELTTTNQVIVSPSNKLVGGEIITHFNNVENSSCLISSDYDYGNINKQSNEKEIYKPTNREVIYDRVMLRGEGASVSINYRSPIGKACEILGFEMKYNIVEK